MIFFYLGAAEPLNNRITSTKRQNWRGVVITAFLLIILIVFILFVAYFIFRRFIQPSVSLMNGERKNYATILNKNRPEITKTTTKIVIQNDKTGKRLDDDYNLL